MANTNKHHAQPNPVQQCKLLFQYIQWLLILALSSLVPIVAVYLDTVVIGWGIKETGVTEGIQHLLVLIIVIIFGRRTKANPDQRGFLILITGFFLIILIRELDAFFDLITHGFWFYPALAVTLLAILLAGLHYSTILGPMLAFFRSLQGTIICIGLVIVLIFSRIFGTTSLWAAILQDEASKNVKTIIQEGLELLGYVLIFLGTYHPQWNQKPSPSSTSEQSL